MATSKEITAGVGDWLQKKIMPRLDNKRQFLLGTLYGVTAGKLDGILGTLQQNEAFKALGIVREDGTIDINTLYEAAYAQMQAQGKLTLDIPLMGTFAFDVDDLRDLRQFIGG